MKVFSLSSVRGTLYNEYYGLTSFGGQSYINLGGGQKQIEKISYTYSTDIFSMSSTADGGVVVAHSNDRSGTISIQLQQTSPHIKVLTEFAKWCWANPDKAESTLTVTDDTGNLAFTATQVFIKGIPENAVGSTATERTYTFMAGNIESQESNIG